MSFCYGVPAGRDQRRSPIRCHRGYVFLCSSSRRFRKGGLTGTAPQNTWVSACPYWPCVAVRPLAAKATVPPLGQDGGTGIRRPRVWCDLRLLPRPNTLLCLVSSVSPWSDVGLHPLIGPQAETKTNRSPEPGWSQRAEIATSKGNRAPEADSLTVSSGLEKPGPDCPEVGVAQGRHEVGAAGAQHSRLEVAPDVYCRRIELQRLQCRRRGGRQPQGDQAAG